MVPSAQNWPNIRPRLLVRIQLSPFSTKWYCERTDAHKEEYDHARRVQLACISSYVCCEVGPCLAADTYRWLHHFYLCEAILTYVV